MTKTIKFSGYQDIAAPVAYLEAMPGAVGTPNVGGYGVTEIDDGLYSFSVADSLLGEFRIKALDSLGELFKRGFVTLGSESGASYEVYDYTNAGETAGLLQEIKAKTDLIGTGQGLTPTRVQGKIITLFVGEQHNFVLQAAEDLRAVTLVLQFEDSDGTVTSIADGQLTKTATTITFAVPAAITEKAGKLDWSLRVASSDEVKQYGVVDVHKTAFQ